MSARAAVFGLAAVIGVVAVLIEAVGGRGQDSYRLPGAMLVLRPAEGLAAASSAWGDVWMDDRGREELLRVDGETGRVIARIPVDGRVALGGGAGAMWALQSGGGFGRGLRGPLLRIDPATSRVTARIPLRTPSGEPVFGFGVLPRGASVWVWGPYGALRVDPRSNRVVQAIATGDERGELTGFAASGPALLATTADGHLVRLDPRTGGRLATVSLPHGGGELVAAGERRVILTAGGVIAAVDGATGRLAWRRRLGFRLDTVLERGGTLVVNGADTGEPADRVWALDASSGEVLDSALLPAFGTLGMAAVDGALWVTTRSGRVLVLLPSWRDWLRLVSGG